jgi:ABC-type glutathione transport system ATPase component
MNLGQFIETYQDAITEAVLRTYPPVYTARNRDEWGLDLRRLRRRPLGAQGDAIRAVAVSLRWYRGTNLVGEMGTGKTTIGAAATYTDFGRVRGLRLTNRLG